MRKLTTSSLTSSSALLASVLGLGLMLPIAAPVAAWAEGAPPDDDVVVAPPVGPVNPFSQYISSHPPSPAGCLPIKVTVLAVSSQNGEGSPQNPTKVASQLSSNADLNGAWVPLVFNGATEVVPGMTTSIPVPPSSCNKKIAFRGSMASPSFDAPTIAQSEISTNPLATIMFGYGDDVNSKIAEMGVSAGYGDQKSLVEELAPFMNPVTGKFNKKNVTIVAYEFGSVAGLPALAEDTDYNDLVLKIDLPKSKVVGQEIALRKSAGESNIETNGNKSFKTVLYGGYTSIAIGFDAPSTVKLTQLRAVVAQVGNVDPAFSAFDYRINAWTSKDAMIASPLIGDIASFEIDGSTIVPTLWGLTGYLPPIVGVKPSYLLSFDLASHNVVVSAGAGRQIGILVLNANGVVGNGDLGLMESTESGETDCRVTNTNPGICNPISGFSTSLYDGRVAADLRGIPQ